MNSWVCIRIVFTTITRQLRYGNFGLWNSWRLLSTYCRPRDDRLWMTLSQVYAHLKQFDDAIVTTKHALLSMKCKDTNGKMVLSLATFHRMRDNDQLSSTSIMYYRYFIDIQRKHTMVGEKVVFRIVTSNCRNLNWVLRWTIQSPT